MAREAAAARSGARGRERRGLRDGIARHASGWTAAEAWRARARTVGDGLADAILEGIAHVALAAKVAGRAVVDEHKMRMVGIKHCAGDALFELLLWVLSVHEGPSKT